MCFGSAILLDGRIMIEGGEYNFDVVVDSTAGFVYDPTDGSWHGIGPPKGWAKIGDAPTVILPNGKFMTGIAAAKWKRSLAPTQFGRPRVRVRPIRTLRKAGVCS
jgi:hypothetical protein